MTRCGSKTAWSLLAALLAAGGFGGGAAKAATLWYNGDYDGNDAAVNQSKVPINIGGNYTLQTALVFNDFVVPAGQSWTVTSVFSNNQLAYYAAPTTATWQIRSGITPGNGGQLVASGDTAAVVTQLHAADGNTYTDPEESISASVPNVVLTAGVYWLAVAPDSVGYYGDQSYEETTSGANSVGLPPGSDGLSYLYSTAPAPQNYALSTLDYSAGVIGTSAAVPEPLSGGLLVLGPAAVALTRRRSRGG